MANCTGFIEPLNLECWFVNVFAGDAFLFAAIAFIAIMTLAGKFRMNTLVGLMMVGLFILIFSPLIPGIYIVTIAIIGLIGFALMKTTVARV